ncbi:alpha/beta fold hydrolase [Methylobacterium nonmethylotrophicum]|uniref:Alpha/beta fold hydrolase n=1 Tax=Methylobacterium nonmethylotrophicum TaxID=1141884 RepID=A0A4Z0NHH6_9HYPH|nr:alpha/beta fold hydrolase [Methylobacterium nonmethylotrophicum]TGD95771.1 alpha/beta fold hydrolase [Methylobacterium nonmethylotrophicum]
MSRRPPTRRSAIAACLAVAAGPALALGEPEPPPPADGETAPGPPAGAAPGAAGRARRGRPPRLALPPTPELPAGGRTGSTAINGTILFFAEFGAGEPVLFLHGGFGNANHWGHQVAALAGTHRVLVMDTRGHGRSPVMGGGFGFPLFARDVEGLLDHLGLAAVSIVGWSDGGITGLRLAMTRPQRVTRLFAFGANATPGGLIPHGSRSPLFAAYAARCKAEYATLSPAPERWPELQAGLSAMWRAEPNYGRADLARITAPTVVAAAEHDELIRPGHAAEIARAIPRARTVTLGGVSHFAMLQDPPAFTAALRTFLAT